MDAQTRALKSHRKRLRARGVKRVEVLVRARDVALVRQVAAGLRSDSADAERLRDAVRGAVAGKQDKTLAEMLYDPSVAGPEFDEVFAEIERSRRDPAMMKMRDIDV
jgi:hypothetical protein